MATFTAPAAIRGLMDAFTTALAAEGVVPVDGPNVNGSGRQEVATVGYTTEDQPAVLDGTADLGDYGASQLQEQYVVNCAVQVVRGDTDIVAARERAYVLVGLLSGAIQADPRLGGAVMLAHVAEMSLSQEQTPQGALAMIGFGVQVQAFAQP